MPENKGTRSEGLNISELDPELIKAIITGVVYVGGLTAVTLATPGGPVVAAIGLGAQGIASNEAVNLMDRAIDRWHANLFVDQGKINKDVAWAMGEAFKLTIEQIRQDWLVTPHYKHLQRTDKMNADLSLNLLRLLETDIPEVLLNSDSSFVNQSAQFLYLDQNAGDEEIDPYLNDILARYAYGHDPELTSLLSRNLFSSFPGRFIQVIEGNGDRNNKAWKEMNRLMWVSTGEALRGIFVTVDNQFKMISKKLEEQYELGTNIHSITSLSARDIKEIKDMVAAISPELSVSYTEAFEAGTRAYHDGEFDEAEKQFNYCLKVAREMDLFHAEMRPLEALASVNIRRGDYLTAGKIYIEIITKLEPKALLANVRSESELDDLFYAHTHIRFASKYLKDIYGDYIEETIVRCGEDAVNTTRFSEIEDEDRFEEFLQNRPKDTELIKKHLEMRKVVMAAEPTLQNALHDFLSEDQEELLVRTSVEDKTILSNLIDRGVFDTFDYGIDEDSMDNDEYLEAINSYDELFETIEAVFEYAYLAGDEEQILSLTFGYGEVLKITKKYDKARIYLDKALTLAEELKNRKLFAIAMRYLGEMDIEEGDKIKGEQRLRDSIREMEDIKIEYPFMEDFIGSMKRLLQSVSEE